MRFFQALGWSLAVVAALAASVGRAQSRPSVDARGAWMLGIGAQVDDEGADSRLGTVYVGVGRTTWLTFAAGRSSSPQDRADIEADTLVFGVDHRFDLVGFALEAERWGDSGVLETEDWKGSLYFERERWRIAFGYEARDIEIPFTLTGPLGGTIRRTAEVSGDSVSVDARVSLAEGWRLYFRLAEYDYDRDLRVLPRIQALNVLSMSTLTLANSFLDSERSLAVERDVRRAAVSGRYVTDRSAIDGSKFETFEAAVLFPVGGRVDLELALGRGRSQFFDAGAYGGLTLFVYGR